MAASPKIDNTLPGQRLASQDPLKVFAGDGLFSDLKKVLAVGNVLKE